MLLVIEFLAWFLTMLLFEVILAWFLTICCELVFSELRCTCNQKKSKNTITFASICLL